MFVIPRQFACTEALSTGFDGMRVIVSEHPLIITIVKRQRVSDAVGQLRTSRNASRLAFNPIAVVHPENLSVER